MLPGGLIVLERSGTPETLVNDLPEPDRRAVVFCHPTESAVVLGSTEDASQLDQDALATARWSTARRRSGGAAVFVGPARQFWCDIFVPASDPLFDLDVTKSSVPIGESWREALIACGMPAGDLEVHRRRLVKQPFSDLVCFLGIGPGEVVMGGRKLVGLSQRRSRKGAWFFTMAPTTVQPELESTFFSLGPERRIVLEAELRERVVKLPTLEGLEEQLALAIEQR